MSSNANANAGAGAGGAVYGLGFIGALVYYWQTSDGFWDHIVGIGQALVWPAFFVYDVLGSIGAS
jgi:hypothetical protein